MASVCSSDSTSTSSDSSLATGEDMFSLDSSLISAYDGLELLFKNDYHGSLEMFEKHSQESLYHSHFYSLVLWLKAYLSLEMPEIEQAQSASEATVEFINEIRPQTIRDSFFVKLFVKTNYESCDDEQLHAELCRIEQILFGTMMEFFVDQSLFVLIKVSYRLRTCYVTYKTFTKLIETHDWESDISQVNFTTGVKLGNGIFNLMFSLLPERVMAMLSIIGFKGSRSEGMKLLNESADENTSRSFLAKFILAGYETYMMPMFDTHVTPVPDTERNVQIALKTCNDSIFFLLFKGRLAMIDRRIDDALAIFEKCQSIPFDLKQLLNLYSWEIMMCHALLGNWEKASEECERLRRYCPWSTSSFLYMEAIFLLQHHEYCLVDEERYPGFEDSEESKRIMIKVRHLLSQVHGAVKRYAGRRIPVEKYVCERTEIFQRDGQLVAPGIELLLGFNELIFIEKRPKLIQPILDHLNRAEKYYCHEIDEEPTILLRLLKSNCHRLLGKEKKAEKILAPIIPHLTSVKDDKHLGPMVSYEMALIKMNLGDLQASRQWLKRAQDYPSYALELIVQIRGHTAYKYVRKMQKEVDCA